MKFTDAQFTNDMLAIHIPKEMIDVAKAYGKERLIELDEETFYNKLAEKHTEFSDRAVLRANHFFEEIKLHNFPI